MLFGFVYVYPMLYMIGYSMMSPEDVVSPMVNYLPTSWYFQNYVDAANTLKFFSTLGQTLLVAVLPSLFQTISCCLVAYGIARFKFPGKKLLFGLIILTFIVPAQLTMIPQVLILSLIHI